MIPHAHLSLGEIPWWEFVILIPTALGFILYARRGEPPKVDHASKDTDDAISSEIRQLDRNLTAHAIGMLQLLAIISSALFLGASKLSSGLFAANAVMIATTLLLAVSALAMVGGPTMVLGLPGRTRRDVLVTGAERVHRRARTLRTASRCLMLTLVIFGVSAVHVLTH